MYEYSVRLEPDDNGTVLVTFPDVPEAITFGEDKADALRRAAEALEAALSIYMDKGEEIPKPGPLRGKKSTVVGVGPLSGAKLALYEALRAEGVRKAELARRLGWRKSQVDRLLDLNHHSRLDQLEAAFAALNKRLTIAIRDAA